MVIRNEDRIVRDDDGTVHIFVRFLKSIAGAIHRLERLEFVALDYAQVTFEVGQSTPILRHPICASSDSAIEDWKNFVACGSDVEMRQLENLWSPERCPCKICRGGQPEQAM
jgi:hypothetical protein